jgi:hypothetical protein
VAFLDGRLSVESRDHASVSQKFKSSVSIRQDNGKIYPYEGACPKVCLTALNSAKQNSVTAYATGHFSETPAKAVRQTFGYVPSYTPVGSFWEITQFNWLVLKLVSEEGSSWFNSVSHFLCY